MPKYKIDRNLSIRIKAIIIAGIFSMTGLSGCSNPSLTVLDKKSSLSIENLSFFIILYLRTLSVI